MEGLKTFQFDFVVVDGIGDRWYRTVCIPSRYYEDALYKAWQTIRISFPDNAIYLEDS